METTIQWKLLVHRFMNDLLAILLVWNTYSKSETKTMTFVMPMKDCKQGVKSVTIEWKFCLLIVSNIYEILLILIFIACTLFN